MSGSIDPAINTPDSHAKLGGTSVPPGEVMIRAAAIAGALDRCARLRTGGPLIASGSNPSPRHKYQLNTNS